MIKCNICGSEFNSGNELIKHLREEHKTTEKKYCLEVLAKKDLLTDEVLEYRSLDQYLLSNFTGRGNLLKWLKGIDEEDAREYLTSSLSDYAVLKSLEYFPSHFELRTISTLVSVKTYLHFFGGGIYDMVESTGLVNRYALISDLKMPELPSKIYEDTREKRPLSFGKKITVEAKKLDYGDYSSGGDLNIERKSLSDLLGTLSSGWTRFQNEMDRAKEAGAYVVILVDTDINTFMGFKFQSQIHSKASHDFIFKRCRDLCRAYPHNVQFLFSGGRRDSAQLIPILLGWGKSICSRLDLQYFKDSGQFDKLCG